MRYLVTAYYPKLPIKARTLDFTSTEEMYEYVGGLRLTDTPYTIHTIDSIDRVKMIEVEYYGMSRAQMAEL